MCHMGPCNAEIKPEPVESSEVEDLLEYLSIPYASVKVDDKSIGITLKAANIDNLTRHIIAAATYRAVIFRYK